MTAWDGTVANYDAAKADPAGADVETFDFDVDDVNEAPKLITTELGQDHSSRDLSSAGYKVNQSESQKKTIWLNLTELFEDEDDNHEDDDISFTASVSGGDWIKIRSDYNDDEDKKTSKPVQWKDIKDGPDGVTGGGDDLTFGCDEHPEKRRLRPDRRG